MYVCVGFSRIRPPFFKYFMSVDNRAKTIDSAAASCGFYQSYSAYVVFNCLKCQKSQLQCLYIFPYKSTPIFFKVCDCGFTGISAQIVGEMIMTDSFGAMLQTIVKDVWLQKLCDELYFLPPFSRQKVSLDVRRLFRSRYRAFPLQTCRLLSQLCSKCVPLSSVSTIC